MKQQQCALAFAAIG